MANVLNEEKKQQVLALGTTGMGERAQFVVNERHDCRQRLRIFRFPVRKQIADRRSPFHIAPPFGKPIAKNISMLSGEVNLLKKGKLHLFWQ